MTAEPEQVEMFDVTEPPVSGPRGARRDDGRVHYQPYAGHERCDDCMALHAERPDAPLARTARVRRRRAGEPERLLCSAHAEVRRRETGD